MDLRTLITVVCIGAAALLWLLPMVRLPSVGSLIAKLRSSAAVTPAVSVSTEVDPAKLCEQAGSLWRQQGRPDLATKAFSLSVESAVAVARVD